jgi:inner membrane protein
MARAGLRDRISRGTLLCVVAANVPDIDIVVGPDLYLTYHRHLTHAVAAIPVMAAVAVCLTWGLGWLWPQPSGPRRFWREWNVALIVAATHPLLDLTNSYGVRVWLPFSAEWTSWDTLFVIDPVVWALLTAALAAPALLGLMRRRRGAGNGYRRAAAWVGLLAVALYIGLNRLWHDRLLEALSGRLYDGRQAVRTAVFPAPLSPLAWIGYVETEDYVLTLPLRVGDERAAELRQGEKHFPPNDDQAAQAAWLSDIGRSFGRFVRYPLTRVESEGGVTTVTLGDYRFLRLGRVGLACKVSLDSSYRVVDERFEF